MDNLNNVLQKVWRYQSFIFNTIARQFILHVYYVFNQTYINILPEVIS